MSLAASLVLVGCGDNGAGQSGSAGESSSESNSATSAETNSASGPSTGESTTSEGTTQYQVRGELVGLQGNQVQVQLGGESLDLSADGSFEFVTPVDDGAQVEVSVGAQPAGPDQGCTVTGNGLVSGADVVVQVRCVTPIRHVVVYGVDGLGGTYVSGIDTPNFDALVAESAWTIEAQNALPTMSSTNWMSMINGSSPDQHGVLSNGWQPGDSNPQITMFQALRDAQPDAKIGIFHDWADFGRLVEPGAADIATHPGDEFETMDAALAYLQAEQPELLFIHLDHVDHEGHFTTWGSGAYEDAVRSMDTLLGTMRGVLESADMWDYTLLIVSSDHGGAGFSHGADTPLERPIPMVVHSPQGTVGQLSREVRIWDLAPTVLAGLGVDVPAVWVGVPVWESMSIAGDLAAAPPAPQGELVFASNDVYDLLWDDNGTGAFSDVSMWRPAEMAGYASVGDVTVTGHSAPTASTLMVRSDDPLALAFPVGYELIWNSAGANGDAEVSLWNPIPPAGYACLGTVATQALGGPPANNQITCVHIDMLQQASAQFVWDDTGSGSTWDGSVWQCIAGGGVDIVPRAFTTRRHHDGPGYSGCYGLDPARAVPG